MHINGNAIHPFRQTALGMAKICVFLEEFDPLRQFHWLAEGGGMMRKRLASALFWPSAN